ncbi:MAG: 23S rRNA (guanosine(2251)-2'-O)-methyltransferase RlmB [Chitinispirillaceae bacterium]|nr:23S rRNA (guanosine(2251)-2'-O)-methyltransferase RlmB [Chitinispirillaceae bacterium]
MYNDQVIYGIHPVEELLKSRLTSIDHVYFEQDRKSAQLFELMKICRKERLSYNLVPETKLQQLTGSHRHQGIAAQCSVLPYADIDEIEKRLQGKEHPLIVVPASIEDPGNLGAIIRSAVAFGADALLLERKHTAPLNAAVAKSSAGMVEHLTVARPKNLEAVIKGFAGRGYAVIGADMKKGRPPQEIRLAGPVVLILGGEHRGIPPYLSKTCTDFVSIPMCSAVQSLNVAASAAVLLYETARQRSVTAP